MAADEREQAIRARLEYQAALQNDYAGIDHDLMAGAGLFQLIGEMGNHDMLASATNADLSYLLDLLAAAREEARLLKMAHATALGTGWDIGSADITAARKREKGLREALGRIEAGEDMGSWAKTVAHEALVSHRAALAREDGDAWTDSELAEVRRRAEGLNLRVEDAPKVGDGPDV